MNIQEQTIKYLSEGLNNKLDKIFIEGLNLKGFEFENKKDIEEFIKLRCRCADNIDVEQKIYYVDDIPFLLHNYRVVYEPITEFNNKTTISANYGTYKFL